MRVSPGPRRGWRGSSGCSSVAPSVQVGVVGCVSCGRGPSAISRNTDSRLAVRARRPVQPDVARPRPSAAAAVSAGLQVVDLEHASCRRRCVTRPSPRGGRVTAGRTEGDRRRGGRRRSRPTVPVADDPAGRHDRDPVGQRLGLLEVVRGQQHGHPVVAQVRGSAATRWRRLSGSRPVVGSSSITTSGRPISVHARSTRRCSPPDSARIRVSARRVEVEHLERLVDRPRVGHGGRPHLQRLAHGQVGDEAAALQQHAGAAAYGGPVGDRVQPEHRHLPGAGRGEPLDHLEGGGLAGTVDAEQGVDGARPRRSGRRRGRPRRRARCRCRSCGAGRG